MKILKTLNSTTSDLNNNISNSLNNKINNSNINDNNKININNEEQNELNKDETIELLNNQLIFIKSELKKALNKKAILEEEIIKINKSYQPKNLLEKEEILSVLKETFIKLINNININNKNKEIIIVILKLLDFSEIEIKKVIEKKK